VLFFVLNLFSVSWSERLLYFKKRKSAIIAFTSYYLFTIVGVFYSLNLNEALFDLEVKLSLLLVPLCLLTSGLLSKYNVYGILKTFIAGVSLATIVQFVLAFINYQDSGDFQVFFYGLLSYFHHPSYFSMYTNFAIASLLVLIFHSRNKPKLKHFALLGFLVVGVYQLSSRAGLLTLTILLLYAFVYLLFPRMKWKKVLYALFATVLISVAILYPITKYSTKIRTVDVSTSNSSSGVRLAMWKSAIPLIKENWVFGVGTGDVNRELQKVFAKDGLVRAVRDNLNAHNQFLQTQVALGIIGTIFLLYGLFFPMWGSIKRGKLFYPLFLLILLINFLTESVLNTQAGVIYFALLNSIVFFTYEEN
jgi:O-antigen ligase